MPLCHYATMPFPPGPWTSMDSMPLRLLCRAHRTLGIVRPFWFLAPWWRCVDLAGWSSFAQPHLEKKLHNVAFHVNKVQHGPAKKKTKASEARFHIQPCGEQASQWIHICHVGRRLDHQLLACPYLVEQQTLVWPKQPLAVAGWQWAKWTSSWFVQVTCDLTNRGGTIPL